MRLIQINLRALLQLAVMGVILYQVCTQACLPSLSYCTEHKTASTHSPFKRHRRRRVTNLCVLPQKVW